MDCQTTGVNDCAIYLATLMNASEDDFAGIHPARAGH